VQHGDGIQLCVQQLTKLITPDDGPVRQSGQCQ